MAISIGAMLGSGIFVLPGLAAAKAGTMIWLAYLLAGVCVLPAAVSKSELSTAMPTSGGTYVYLERAFGPLIGTIAGFGLWLSLVLKSSFALVGFGAYLLVLVDFPLRAASLLLLLLIVVINVLGVRKVGRTQVVIIAIALVGLLFLVLLGALDSYPTVYEPVLPHGMSGLLSATAFVFVSYAGVTKIAAIAEEVENPGRNLPLAMMISLAVVTVLYVVITRILVGIIPLSSLTNDLHPIYSLGIEVGGRPAGLMAAGLAVITMTSMANSGLLAASRFPLAMARDRLLPSVFRQVNPHFLTPVTCILLTALLMASIIAFLDVENIAKLASAFKITMFIAVNVSVIVLRETGVQWYKPHYLSPLYPWLQIFGIVSGVLLLCMLGTFALFATIGIIMIGIIMFLLYGRKYSERHGVVRLYGHRAVLSLLSGRYRDQKQERFEQRVKEKREQLEEPVVRTLAGSEKQVDAAVVVPLFGLDRSPEVLVEIGSALAKGSRIQAVHVTEIPDQTLLDAMMADDPVVRSLDRRFQAVSEEKGIDLEFDAVVTHDVVRTVRNLSNRLHCEWMVMGWDGRSGEGLLVRNPVGWLIHHLSCNLALFKDSGVRYIREILVVVGEKDRDSDMVITVADQIAATYNARLAFIDVVPADAADTIVSSVSAELKKLQALTSAPSETMIFRGDNRIASIIEHTSAYDLLVTGSPPEEGVLATLFGLGRDELTDQAACSVLRLSRPALNGEKTPRK